MTLIGTRPSSFNPFAVDGMVSSGAKRIAPDVGQQEPDADWQPI